MIPPILFPGVGNHSSSLHLLRVPHRCGLNRRHSPSRARARPMIEFSGKAQKLPRINRKLREAPKLLPKIAKLPNALEMKTFPRKYL